MLFDNRIMGINDTYRLTADADTGGNPQYYVYWFGLLLLSGL